MDDRFAPRAGIPSRRGFLAAATVLALSSGIRRGFAMEDDEPEPDLDSVRRRAVEAGLGPVRSVTGPTYIVVGDAPEPFLQEALRICEALAGDYLDHFTRRQFQVERPKSRLTVVALSGPEAFSAYLGTTEDEAVGGQYDLDTNRLIIFDNRRRADAGPMVERANTVSLMHEAMHQLTFNTGLLRRGSAIPLAINEGLGTYAETRRPDGRTPIGRPNEGRLLVLVDAMRSRRPWIGSAELLSDDQPFASPDSVQQAYAQSWLLVFHLLQDRERIPQFRRFVEGLASGENGQPAHVPALVAACFGDLDRLDRELQATLRRLVRR